MKSVYPVGVDIGSTTAKVVILNKKGDLIFSRYRRHQARTVETALEIFKEALQEIGNPELDPAVTGSAGMGAAETLGLPFVQEVVASAHLIREKYPEVRTFIEIGGEDAKIIFFDDNLRPNIRMNGSCAGGTGAFIDQMAVLLNIPVSEFNSLAEKSESIYPIASRCGVFAKTDIQALLSQDVSKEDIAASVFHSVALQVISSLSRGREIRSKVLIGGGPLTFYPALRKAFLNILSFENKNDLIVPDHPELIPAMGAAITQSMERHTVMLRDLIALPAKKNNQANKNKSARLAPLFESRAEYDTWLEEHTKDRVPRSVLSEVRGENLFLGVDSGSTTTKLVLVNQEGRIVLSHYGSNHGNPIEAVKSGLSEFREKFIEAGFQPQIIRAAATGYGEDLIMAAFGLNDGVVETMAHYRAAKYFDKDISFILDIGGQDMKAIYINNGAVSNIQVNEACSSGCGSFIETFARSMGYEVADFAKIACERNTPFDLGTRCTVFMNSKVKQALREGASISDISAGLAYSVIKNSLYKVLKLKDTVVLGNRIIAQGGTFKNHAVLRAFELLLQKKVIRPDIPELMGAFGAALTAAANHSLRPDQSNLFNGVAEPDLKIEFTKKKIECKGCENRCAVAQFLFTNGNRFYTGNRCERHFSNGAGAKNAGINLASDKIKLLFQRNTEPSSKPILTFGIPGCLNIYENFPFWCELLVSCGFKVELSSPSNFKLFEKGLSTVMSENICFPAKLAHGHIFNLIDRGVDRIFYPNVVYENIEYTEALNSYNCPVVTGYPDVLKSAIDPEGKYKIPLDNPAFSFKDKRLLKKQLHLFLKQFGISAGTVSKSVEKGLAAQGKFRAELKQKAGILVAGAEQKDELVVVLAGRPYHVDPLINHGIPNLLAGMGVHVITEDSIPEDNKTDLADIRVLTQWAYANRLFAAAEWVAQNQNTEIVQITSFGCGPDAITSDEIRDIIVNSGKIYTMIKMDEIANLGAVKIRLRSMLEAVRENRSAGNNIQKKAPKIYPVFTPKDKKKTLIAPYFSPFYSPLIPAAFRPFGLKVEVLPPQDKASVEFGLKHINNDMCYPAVMVAGDIIKAFKTGRYDPADTSVIMTQTGGQCRASSYVGLIRKCLAADCLDQIPVVTLSEDGLEPQSGFQIDRKDLFKHLGLGIIFADPVAQMCISTAAREKNPGDAKRLHAKYLAEMNYGIENADYNYLLNLLKRAVSSFNDIEICGESAPKIGVVGEIFVKYNFFSNGNIIEWLSQQGVEVVLPSLHNFFAQRIINETYNQKTFFKQSLVDLIKTRILDIYTGYHFFRIERVMQDFRFYRKPFNLKKLAETTEQVVSLANQFGEGWLLTAEMIGMLENGIGNIVCLQPFGCISNHITGSGMEKKLKQMYPYFNLLSLDMDAGSSEVNILNRLHFMLIAAKEESACDLADSDRPFMIRHGFIPRIWPVEASIFNNYLSPDLEKWKTWVSGLGLWKKAENFIHRDNGR